MRDELKIKTPTVERTFTVLYFDKPDSKGDVFTKDCKITYNKLPKILWEFNAHEVAGVVTRMDITDSEIKVTAMLFPETENLIPAIAFEVIECVKKVDTSGKEIHGIRLFAIGLSHYPNADESIKSIKEQHGN